MPMKRVDFTTKQREYWVNLLLSRDGYHCVSCAKDVQTLIRESKPNRTLPVLVIDHIDGDTRYCDSKDGGHGGNLRLLCYSCNRKNTKSERPVMPSRDRTPEQKKSEDSKPVFYNWVNAYLIENKDICYNRMLNRGSKIANDSSQVTVKRWYDQMVDVLGGYEEFYLNMVNGDCDYSKCNNIHVCFYGEVPREQDVARQQVLDEGIPDYDDANRFT
jgi:hypothetical protein